VTGVIASEQRSLELAAQILPQAAAHAKTVIDRINAVHPLPADAAILDVGAAQGLFVAACAEMGYRAVGVEPWSDARAVAQQIAHGLGLSVSLLDGVAEALPVESESFDLVHAMSVIEHVDDAEAAFNEAYRVLKPGGVFWFATASSMCPKQNEIRGFPGFGWYPDPLKIRIMNWVKDHRSDLIAHTTRPAYHWFTPWKARRMLRSAGFTRILDRWDLRLPSEGGKTYRTALALARSSAISKGIADIFVPTCSYAAFK
jgi:SAM-dependent methyltransferase